MDSRVLIAESDEELRNRLQRKLLDAGVFADSVADGRAALEMLDERVYAMIVLDIGLSAVDGITILDRLRKVGISKRPMLLVTADRGQTPALDGEIVQMVLRKPYDARQIAEVIANCLRAVEEQRRRTAPRGDETRDRAEA